MSDHMASPGILSDVKVLAPYPWQQSAAGKQARERPSADVIEGLARLRGLPGAPSATVEALVYELRTRGLAALTHPNCLRRLDDVSTAQLREVISRLIRLRPKYPSITDDLLLKLGGLL
jgi:hypothetical protein